MQSHLKFDAIFEQLWMSERMWDAVEGMAPGGCESHRRTEEGIGLQILYICPLGCGAQECHRRAHRNLQ